MSDTNLGQLVRGNPGRDAIHIAVAPVAAGEYFKPGTHVRIVDGKAISARPEDSIGIVDPFLLGVVEIGQTFWLCLYPKTITSLRHEWVHPAFDSMPTVPVKTSADVSNDWLHDFAGRIDIGYSHMMRAAKEWLRSGEYECEYNSENWRDGFDHEFWKHYDIVTGNVTPDSKRENFFTCSC